VIVAAEAARATSASLGTATWLVREPGSGTRATTDALFEALAIEPPTVTINSNGAILACVRAGLGVSLLSRGALARDLQEGSIVEVVTRRTPLQRDWHLVGLRERATTTGAALLIEHAISHGGFRAA